MQGVIFPSKPCLREVDYPHQEHEDPTLREGMAGRAQENQALAGHFLSSH